MISRFQSSNPILTKDRFKSVHASGHQVMTIDGTVNKAGMLLGITALSSVYAWSSQVFSTGLWIGVMIVGLVLALLTYAKPQIAHITAPLYCAAKGLVLGSVSVMAEARFPGIVTNALVLTFGLMAVMLSSYKMGWVRATPKLQKMVSFALMAYFVLFITSMIASMFGADIGSLFHHGPIAIGISLFGVGLGALFLVLDFDEIEQGAMAGLDKQQEWVGAFGLMVTLIWIYWEMLRLLMILQSSDD